MRTKAAVCYGLNQPFVVKEVELDEPKEREVLVSPEDGDMDEEKGEE